MLIVSICYVEWEEGRYSESAKVINVDRIIYIVGKNLGWCKGGHDLFSPNTQ